MHAITDILIVGGGPVGMFAAFYAGMRQASVKIVESLHQLGGQPAALYPEKWIYDIPAHPKINGEQLATQLLAQMQTFQPTICLGEEVLSIAKDNDGHFVVTTNQATHLARTVILAMGNGSFNPKKLEVPGASDYEHTHVHYFVSSQLAQFQGKRVAICGGGDSALDWALALSPIAETVYLIHRRPQFRAHEHSVAALATSRVQVKTPYLPTAVIGDGTHVTHLEIATAKRDHVEQLPVDDILVHYGFSSNLSQVRQWGLTLHRQAINVDTQMMTTIPGIYAIGDICTYVGKTKLIATGFGEAPIAVNAAIARIRPEDTTHPVHSTTYFETRQQ